MMGTNNKTGPPPSPTEMRLRSPSSPPPALRAMHNAPISPDDPAPATALATKLMAQMEHYFSDENLEVDIFMLGNLNSAGFAKVSLFTTFLKIKKLTTDMEFLILSIKLSSHLELNDEEDQVRRKNPLSSSQTYQGRMARMVVGFNFNDSIFERDLEVMFKSVGGEVKSVQLVKGSNSLGGNASLYNNNSTGFNPPLICALQTYVLVEYTHEESAHNAVLTLTDQANRRGDRMQVVLHDGTGAEELKRKLFSVHNTTQMPPMSSGSNLSGLLGIGAAPHIDPMVRRRAKSVACAPPSSFASPLHVEAVGEGLEGLKEGKN